jgi:hypothetical protein
VLEVRLGRKLRVVVRPNASRPLGIAAPSVTGSSAESDNTDDESDETDALLAKADQTIQDFEQHQAKLDAEFRASAAEIRVRLDHRLFLVRDVVGTLVSARDKFNAAIATCESIADANQGYFRLPSFGWKSRR